MRDSDEVVCLAYSTVPKTSFDDPVQDIIRNLPPSVVLLDVASNHSIDKLVIISSGGTVYGKCKDMPIREDFPKNPLSPYGITKLAIENYAMMFYESRGLPVICVRPGNAYGERQIPFVGQGFVSTAIASALEHREIVVYGKDAIRDYVHVTDIARGILASLDRGKTGTSYNIGTGIGMSNMEVLESIRPYATDAHLELRMTLRSPRPFDVPVNILDSTKLRVDTGWSAKITFEEGIRRSWNWFSSRREKDELE